MTGTSCDGLDASCVEFEHVSLKQGTATASSDNASQVLWQTSIAYPKALRKRVLALQRPSARIRLADWLDLDRDLGAWYGAALAKLIATRDPKPDAIANHGQTVGHFPAPRGKGTTCQLGDPARIAAKTGLTVISDFRSGDLAAGGQGAPLVPLYHRRLARLIDQAPSDPSRSKLATGEGLSIHNIGGISNLTYVGPKERLLAFDTGPGNIWIDAAVERATRGKQRLDRGGRMALRGTPDWDAVKKILNRSYFGKKPPKSTGRDDFPFELLLHATRVQGPDLVATATWVTAESIARAYERQVLDAGLPLRAVFVCGGGARNETLLEALRVRLPHTSVETLAEAGIDPQFVEAQAFAYFGLLALQGLPLGGEWTGAQGFGSPARITPGENWRNLLTVVGPSHY
jgi:anhydro-N-acetylmuramic acid kinase